MICEIVDDDGSMARLPRLLEFAKEHGLAIVSIADLVAYRRRTERTVERVADASCRPATASGGPSAIAARSTASS